MRMMLALSALEDWHIKALDVKTASLYGKLDEEIYMEQPEGFRLKVPEAKKYSVYTVHSMDWSNLHSLDGKS